MKKRDLINFAIVVIILIAGIYYIFIKEPPPISAEDAKCIGENAILYWTTGCPHCQVQKDMF